MTQDECKAVWEELKKETLKKIREIDKETPWSCCEPEWWLEMSNVERVLMGQEPLKFS